MKYVEFIACLMIFCNLLTFSRAAVRKRIINAGINAKKGQFPYMVQVAELLKKNDTYSTFNVCGGSLIHPKWILTAGQCFPDNEEVLSQTETNKTMIAIMGNLISMNLNTSTSVPIEKVIRHPDYQHIVSGELEAVSDDIALAQTSSKFELSEDVQTITLAAPSLLDKIPVSHRISDCTIMGFGIADDENDNRILPLKYANIIIVPSSSFNISDSANVFVSVSQKKSVQNYGDIGSPLVCKDLQFGIVSALVIIDTYYVNLYTEVEKYKKFILEHVPEAKFEVPKPPPDDTKSSAVRYTEKLENTYLKMFGTILIFDILLNKSILFIL